VFRRKEERKAKEYVRQTLEAVNPSDSSVEEKLESLEDNEQFKMILADTQREMDVEEVQQPLIGHYAPLKRKLIYLYVSGGYTTNQMSRILGVAPQTVRNWLRLEDVKAAIEQYQMEEDAIVSSSLKALRMKAVKTTDELLDSDNDMVRAMVVRDVLDRTGHKAVEKKEVNVNLTYEQRLQMILNGDGESKDMNVENVDYSINGEEPQSGK
jgi:transposase-like protein